MEQKQQTNHSPETERVKIDDMPKLEDMTPEEQQGIVGGGLISDTDSGKNPIITPP